MGGGVSHTSSTAKVAALAADNVGNVYVGGWFNRAGAGEHTIEVSNLARWNGAAWSDAGGGVQGSVAALHLSSSALFVGGTFTQAGQTAVNNIARFNLNSQWDAMEGGVAWDDSHPAVYAIACADTDCNKLYVGGEFDTAGGVDALCVAYRYWDGSTYRWEALDYGLSEGGKVRALLWRDEGGGNFSLYVGGTFSRVGDPGPGSPTAIDARGVARWDGTEWSALALGVQGGEGVKALLWDGGGLIAAGNFITVGVPSVAARDIARWDGTAWSAMGDGLGTEWYSEVNALLLDAGGHIVAGGGFDFSSERVVNNLAAWDGSQWSAFGGGSGVNNAVDIMLADGDSVYVHGAITQFGPLVTDNLATLTGLAWNAGMGSPAPSYIRGLAKQGIGRLYAGGAFAGLNYLAYWDGGVWQTFAGGANGYVNAVAYGSDANNLYVGGEFTQVGAVPASYFAWNKNLTWETTPPDQDLNGPVRSMAVDAQGNVFVAGDFTYAGDLRVNHIAMWDGEQWRALGDGLAHRYVLALTFDGDGRLYAGGCFAKAGGLQVNGVAMWNGLQWSALDGGADNCVGALAVDRYGQLYAAGDFTQAGGGAANHIARWDGFQWSALGNGTDGNVRALAVVSGSTYNRLVVGGIFSVAGDKLSTNVAAYDIPLPQTVPSPTITSISPTHIAAGGTGFWLTVNGENFSSRTYVKWEPLVMGVFGSGNGGAGVPLTTTYISSTQLQAYVPPELTTTEGAIRINVFTPAVEGGGGGGATNPELPVFEVVKSYRVFLPLVIRSAEN